jgi:hypothetical protein
MRIKIYPHFAFENNPNNVRSNKERYMQQVSLGVTKLGRFGYFTNGILAWGLTPEEYAKGDEWHTQHAKSLGFAFISEVA